MAKYAVEIKPSARKELERLTPKVIERIFRGLKGWALSRARLAVRSSRAGKQDWRIRVGDYRVVYTIDDSKLRVSVTRIRHRSEVYEA